MNPEILTALQDRFSLREASICLALGLNRDEVRQLRNSRLKKGDDWEVVKNRICYASGALDLLRAALSIPPLKKTSPSTLQEAPDPLVELITLRTRNPNKRILLAHVATEEASRPNWVYIRVRNNAKYRPGMKLLCHHVGGDLWEHFGRVPRGT